MKEKMLEDELEGPGSLGSGELLIACLCLSLSLLFGLVWVCLLVAPQLLHASKL
jgi:hypothetical protein